MQVEVEEQEQGEAQEEQKWLQGSKVRIHSFFRASTQV